MSGHTIGRPMEILLVEDGLLDAKLTIAALRKSGLRYRLTLIRDGEEAVQFLLQAGKFAQAPRPDLILLDLLLPKRDGLEVLTEVRQDDQLRDIPVVILTASEDEQSRSLAELYQVEHYLRKPVNFDKFLEVVKKLRHRWRQDLILPLLD
jgi:two-component system, chemotaxis family, response regulator Rcp1